MVNWVPIVAATLAAIPSAAIFFAAYGRYDGTFRDNVVFLFFIGGLVVGGFLGFFSLLLAGFTAPLVEVVGLALLFPIVLVAAVNRRKWQGDRHAIFNGGAVGLGAAVMLGFSILYHTMQAPLDVAVASWAANHTDNATHTLTQPFPGGTAPYAFVWAFDVQGLLLCAAFAGLLFGVGLLAGDAVRQRKQIRVAFLGTAILLAPVVFLEEYQRSAAWLWVILLLAYGAVLGIVAERRLLPLALEDNARRARRRRARQRS